MPSPSSSAATACSASRRGSTSPAPCPTRRPWSRSIRRRCDPKCRSRPGRLAFPTAGRVRPGAMRHARRERRIGGRRRRGDGRSGARDGRRRSRAARFGVRGTAARSGRASRKRRDARRVSERTARLRGRARRRARRLLARRRRRSRRRAEHGRHRRNGRHAAERAIRAAKAAFLELEARPEAREAHRAAPPAKAERAAPDGERQGCTNTTLPVSGRSTPCQPVGSAGSVKKNSLRASSGERLMQPWLFGVPKRSCQYAPCSA